MRQLGARGRKAYGRNQRARRALAATRPETVPPAAVPRKTAGHDRAPGGEWSSASRRAAARIWIGVNPRRASLLSAAPRIPAISWEETSNASAISKCFRLLCAREILGAADEGQRGVATESAVSAYDRYIIE